MSYTLGVISIVIGITALHAGEGLLVPLISATLLALLLAPVASFFERYLKNTTLAALVTSFLSYGLLLAFMLSMFNRSSALTAEIDNFGPRLQRKLVLLEKKAKTHIKKLGQFTRLQRRPAKASAPVSVSSDPVSAIISAAEEPGAAGPISLMIGAALKMLIPPFGAGLLELFLVILLSTVFLIFRHSVRTRLLVLAGPKNRQYIIDHIHEGCSRLGLFLCAFTCANILFALVLGVFFSLLKVPSALFFALSLGVLRFVPFIGVPLGMLATSTILFVSASSWSDFVIPAIMIIAVDILITHAAEPLLFSKSCNIHPLVVIVSALFWAWLWGPVGLILATPLTMSLLLIASYFPSLAPYAALATNQPPDQIERQLGGYTILSPSQHKALTKSEDKEPLQSKIAERAA